MADVTKITYVSPERLGYYDSKIKAYLKAQDDAIKAEVDELAGKIGEVAEGKTVMGIIDEIQKSAYDDTEIRDLIGDLDENKADKTQVATDIENAVKAEKERAMGVEGGLEDRIETMEAFWEAAAADETDKNVIDTLKEIQDYIASDETGASEMAASIKQNTDAIAEHVATDHNFAAADTALENKLTGLINAKADASALDEVSDKVTDIETALGAEGTTGKAIAELEAAVATKAENADLEALEGVVSGKADASVVEGISGKVTTLEGQVATKAEASVVEELTETVNGKADAQTVTDLANTVGTVAEGETVVGMISGVEARVEELEAIEHTEISEEYINSLFNSESTA